MEFHGIDGFGGPLYIGTGCFHKRESLCGMKFNDEYKHNWKTEDDLFKEANLQEMEEKSKDLASCSYEKNTQWGKEVLYIYSFFLTLNSNIYEEKIIKVKFISKS